MVRATNAHRWKSQGQDVTDEWREHRTTFKKPSFAVPKGATDCHCHIVGDVKKYPLAPNRSFDPFPASQEEYLSLMSTLGIERTVIVQPSFYGFDNSCTLAAINAFGQKRARGICVVEPEVGTYRLRELDAGGFRGIRFITLASGGASIDALPDMAKKIAPLGWHVQMYVTNNMFASLESVIKSLPVPVVFDHMADIQSNMTMNEPAFQTVLRLLDTGRCYVKLSGYRSSVGGYPYSDVAWIAKAFIAHAPERCLWGTDWPHPRVKDHMPDDGELLDLVADWAPDAKVRQKILSDNPKTLYGFES